MTKTTITQKLRRLLRQPATFIRTKSGFNKPYASLVVLMVVVTGIYVVLYTRAATNELYLSPSNGTVLSGKTVDVAVRINSGTVPVNVVDAKLAYDPAKFEYVGVSDAGSAFPVSAITSNTAGLVNIVRATTGSLSGDKLVATVTFRALGSSGPAAITTAATSSLIRQADAVNILVNRGSASFTLASGPTPTPFITPAPTPTPTPIPSTPPPPTPSSTPTPGTARLLFVPGTQNADSGQTVTVGIHTDSGSTPVRAVQANFSYPTSQLQFVSFNFAGSAFGVDSSSRDDNGRINIAREISTGAAGVTGDQPVGSVTFNVVGASGPANLAGAEGSSITLSDASRKNIFSTWNAGNITIIPAPEYGPGATASPTPSPNSAPSTNPTQNPAQVSITGGAKAIPVAGRIKLTTSALPANGPVVYTIDGKPANSDVVDTTKLSDGIHTITATSGGKTVQQQIVVDNHQGTLQHVLAFARQSAPVGIVIVVIAMAILGNFAHRRRTIRINDKFAKQQQSEPAKSGEIIFPDHQDDAK